MAKTYPPGDPPPVKHPECWCGYKAGGYTQEQADREYERHQARFNALPEDHPFHHPRKH